jgi:hypothetical protein
VPFLVAFYNPWYTHTGMDILYPPILGVFPSEPNGESAFAFTQEGLPSKASKSDLEDEDYGWTSVYQGEQRAFKVCIVQWSF